MTPGVSTASVTALAARDLCDTDSAGAVVNARDALCLWHAAAYAATAGVLLLTLMLLLLLPLLVLLTLRCCCRRWRATYAAGAAAYAAAAAAYAAVAAYAYTTAATGAGAAPEVGVSVWAHACGAGPLVVANCVSCTCEQPCKPLRLMSPARASL